MAPIPLIATAAFGLEAVVARELRALDCEPTRTEPGRVHFDGDATAVARANLWLRSADRVLVKVGDFAADDFDLLFDTTRALEWEYWIPRTGAFPVRGRSIKSRLSSVPACQRAVKKAVAEHLLAAHHTASLPESGAEYRIEVALRNDRALLTLDTSGVGLHKRGYRTHAGPAPLKETLAAALVQLSYWRRDRPFLDPFCGAGTIPIEAALIARHLAPGRNRRFLAEAWEALPTHIWADARAEADDLARPATDGPILGTDIDGDILEHARLHARQAGVETNVEFRQRAFADLDSELAYGVLVTNPPYGERLEDREQVRQLYAGMPLALARLPTWSHYILVADPAFERTVGRKADRRRKLYNARIACTYYQFHGPPPPRAGDARPAEPTPAFAPLPDTARQQARDFAARLRKRAHHLRRWPTRRGITCFRLYDRDVPGVPLVIDRYEDFLHVVEVELAGHHDWAQHEAWLDLMRRTLCDTLEIPPHRVFVKRRQRQRGATQHEKIAEEEHTAPVREGGLTFLINLSDYIDTGLFLDHRVTRGMVRDMAAGKRFLNLFAYTGAFTVYAAAGDAVRTTSVDLSRNYLDRARENLRRNGLKNAARHRFVRGDTLQFLRSLPTDVHYDLAMVDPPTFSNSKALARDWDVQRDHAQLLALLTPHMAPGGTIFFSTNFRGFRFTAEDSGHAAKVREITAQTVPEDFHGRPPHRCWRIDLAD